MRTLELSLPALQQNFKKAEFAATLECAGNRRAEMKAIPAPCDPRHTIKGLDWDAGAIGTAVWGGVKLRDVLLAAGGGLVVVAETRRGPSGQRAVGCESLGLAPCRVPPLLALDTLPLHALCPPPLRQACSRATPLSRTSTFTAVTWTSRALLTLPPSLSARP
jgi:DMSO/TMAO reductase YedYZ molybdopterin-dependent catalytic subunit